jgi:agmatine deiminase
VARFTDESTLLYNGPEDRSDPRHALFEKARAELEAATTESGKPLTLVPLPVPEVHQVTSMIDWRKTTLTDAAHSNYLVANGVVLVPVSGHAHDQRAKAIIAEQLPGREVVGIDVVGLFEHGGAIGCVTQPQPLGNDSHRAGA